MEIEINLGVCDTCKGLDKCNRYCVLHAGKALADFIMRIDAIEAKIGEFRKESNSDVDNYVVSGHQVWSLEYPSWILTPLNTTTLDATLKFNSLHDKNPIQLITSYYNTFKKDATEMNEVIDKLKKINKNTLLVLPFKPHTICSVDVELATEKLKKKEAEIAYIRWETNRNTFKLECIVGFSVHTPSLENKIYKVNITDYISKFRLSLSELQAKNSKYDSELIKVTNHGIFKPIVIKDDKYTIAVDGSYMYSTINNDTRIIGYWDDKNKMKMLTDTKSKSVKKLLDNIEFISNHKKYMAPYLLYTPNIINL